MTPDELKAIAERAKIRRAIFSWDSLAATLKQTEADRKALLSHIQDIRRDTAREIVEMIEKESVFIERHCTPDDNRIARAFRQQIASIRTAYGVEG